jgi:hypothetical protein
MSDTPEVVEALQSVVDYCRFSQGLANEGVTPEAAKTADRVSAAVGLARAYQDVADRLEERLADATPRDAEKEAKLLSRMLFESRERVEMAADMVEARTGQLDGWGRRLVAEIDAYRDSRGWSRDGFGGER